MCIVIGILCGVVSLLTGIAAVAYADCRKKNGTVKKPGRDGAILYLKRLSKKHWLIHAGLAVGIGIVCGVILSYPLLVTVQLRLIAALFILNAAMLIDYLIQKIPNFLVAAGFVCRLAVLLPEWLMDKENMKETFMWNVIGVVVFFLFLLVMSVVTRHGMGMGDVKLLGMLAFLIGMAATFYTFLYAAFFAMFAAVVLLLFKKKRAKDIMPFGPFLFAGYVVAILLGTFDSMAV